MAGIIKASINLNAIDKSKIIEGKKGKYLPITITVNDEPDQFGNQGPVIIDQSKEEREAKIAKTYLGNSFLSIYHISITNPSCYQELYLLYCTAYQQASAAVDGHGEGKLQYNIMH